MQECWQSRNCMMIYKTLHLTPLVEQCVHGDPANPLRVHLQAPFRVGILTRDMEMFNESMSAVRSSVEWLFGDIVNYFKFLDLKKKLEDWTQSSRKNVHSMFYFKEWFNLSLFRHNS